MSFLFSNTGIFKLVPLYNFSFLFFFDRLFLSPPSYAFTFSRPSQPAAVNTLTTVRQMGRSRAYMLREYNTKHRRRRRLIKPCVSRGLYPKCNFCATAVKVILAVALPPCPKLSISHCARVTSLRPSPTPTSGPLTVCVCVCFHHFSPSATLRSIPPRSFVFTLDKSAAVRLLIDDPPANNVALCVCVCVYILHRLWRILKHIYRTKTIHCISNFNKPPGALKY